MNEPYRDRMIAAVAAAVEIHGAQRRKGTTIPYLSHLLGTCAIALDYGATEIEAIAAFLHDAIEDGQPSDAVRATVRSFGQEVAEIVDGCTDAVPAQRRHGSTGRRRTSRSSTKRTGRSCSCPPPTSSTTPVRSSVALSARIG